MPTSGSYNFDIFEENKYFSEKYGPDASFEHLTPASVDKIKEIEKKLETRDILSSREMGKMHYPRIYVSKKYDDLWNISRMRSMTLAADVLPYFPMMLCRVLSKGTQQYSFDNKIVNAFGQGKISSRSSTTSFRDRKKRINSGEDRGRARSRYGNSSFRIYGNRFEKHPGIQ